MKQSSSESARTLSWRRKLLFAAITFATFFLLLEAGLALIGVQPVTTSADPFVGFSRQIPLMERTSSDAGESILWTSPGKRVWFNPQSFPLRKRAGSRRVFCVGGSTTYGRPFADPTSYPGWLRELLPVVDPSTKWEVINAGGISYASYRVAAVMEELAQYDPDLFIVYSAQNEFLERRTYEGMFEKSQPSLELNAALQKTRTWSLVHRVVAKMQAASTSPAELLPSEVDEMLNHSIGPKDYHRDDAWHAKVLRHYEFNLERMISIARRCGAEIVFVTPASNLRDCSPFKTETSLEPGDARGTEIESQLELVSLMLNHGQFESALAICSAILQVDSRSAQTHYQSGQALFGLGRYEEAEVAFRRAIDEDVCPLRATSDIVAAIRRVAAERQVPLVDFEQQLRSKCQRELGHGCVGGEYFLDHVHPTIDEHRDLALWIIAELQHQGWLAGSPPSDAEIERVRGHVEDRIDARVQGIAFRNLAKVLHWAGKFQEAAPRARDAIRLIPDDLESRFLLADCLVNGGNEEAAVRVYEELFERGDYPRAYLPFGELLAGRGEFDAAKSYLMQALLAENVEHRARAYFKLGLVHLSLGEHEFAAQSLIEADKLYPNDPATLLWLAEAYLGSGQTPAAMESLRQVIQLDPGNFDAHYKLGMALLSQNQLSAARQHIETAINIDPTDNRARQALESMGQLESVPAK